MRENAHNQNFYPQWINEFAIFYTQSYQINILWK